MKKTIYTFNNNTNNASFPSTNYSKILDDLIAADLIKKNSYLKNYTTAGTIDDDFIDCMMKDSAKKHSGIFIDSIARSEERV